MSSLFKTIRGNTVKGVGGKSRPIPFYLQFVPGYVIEVVTSSKSPHYQGEETINTIIAFLFLFPISYIIIDLRIQLEIFKK